MSRKYIDCRENPSQMHCSVALSADSEEELLEAAVQHAISVHGQQDSPAFRNELRRQFREGSPPLDSPMPTQGKMRGAAQAGPQP